MKFWAIKLAMIKLTTKSFLIKSLRWFWLILSFMQIYWASFAWKLKPFSFVRIMRVDSAEKVLHILVVWFDDLDEFVNMDSGDKRVFHDCHIIVDYFSWWQKLDCEQNGRHVMATFQYKYVITTLLRNLLNNYSIQHWSMLIVCKSDLTLSQNDYTFVAMIRSNQDFSWVFYFAHKGFTQFNRCVLVETSKKRQTSKNSIIRLQYKISS